MISSFSALHTWLGRAVLCAACVAVVSIYFWIARPAVSQLGNPTAREAYYNLLVDGFRDGHLYLKKEPPPEMARLANPYDPQQNSAYRLHDATYFKGRYYIYFGATPALVLLLPYTMLTGEYLWHSETVAIFCAGSFLVAVILLAAAQRRYFPKTGPMVMGALVAGLGLANAMPIMLRRPDVWEVPIACASFFVMLSLAAVWQVLHASRSRVGWAVLASLAYGLAVSARPPVLLGAAMLLVPVGVQWLRGKEGRPAVARLLLAVIAPITLIGCALMFYNWLRFGNVLEFGQKYQLAGVDNTKQTFFGVGYFWYHLRLYLWEPLQWTWYFPFYNGIRVPPAPPGQLGVESVFGLLTNLPLVWFALACVVSVGSGKSRLEWRAWLCTLGLVAMICGVTVCFFGGATNRYFVDFLPAWVLLAGLGILILEHGLATWKSGWRWPVRSVWWTALLFSVAVNFFASCEHLNLLQLRDGAGYRRLARFFNVPVAGWERFTGVHDGPLELRLKLPKFTQARTEPLLMTGYGVNADYIWINYRDEGHIVIGMEHTGHGGPISSVIPVDYGQEHRVVVSMGSLYAPDTHPRHEQLRSVAEVFTRQQVRVEWDGQEIISKQQKTYDGSPATRYVGETPGITNFGVRFTGEIMARRILDVPPSDPRTEGDGTVILRLRFGSQRAAGTTEPLIQTGETGRADALFVRYLDEKRAVLGLDHWGYGGPVSSIFALEDTRDHELEVHMESLNLRAYQSSSGAKGQKKLWVKLDGRTLLEGDQEFYPASAAQIFIGLNSVQASMSEIFTGRIMEVRSANGVH
jgi:hypothetical protein